jgi:RNA polymerase subunit RPABC4/transcription elongation factor Spt4
MRETMAEYRSSDKDSSTFSSKKCHGCYTYVPLDAKICPSCKVRLGKVGAHGMAQKVTDWKGYFAFLVALAAFVIFCIYAFF